MAQRIGPRYFARPLSTKRFVPDSVPSHISVLICNQLHRTSSQDGCDCGPVKIHLCTGDVDITPGLETVFVTA